MNARHIIMKKYIILFPIIPRKILIFLMLIKLLDSFLLKVWNSKHRKMCQRNCMCYKTASKLGRRSCVLDHKVLFLCVSPTHIVCRTLELGVCLDFVPSPSQTCLETLLLNIYRNKWEMWFKNSLSLLGLNKTTFVLCHSWKLFFINLENVSPSLQIIPAVERRLYRFCHLLTHWNFFSRPRNCRADIPLYQKEKWRLCF